MADTPDQRKSPARGEGTLATDAALPPSAVDAAVLEAEDRKWTPAKIAIWAAVALLGGVAWFMLAIVRGETVNAIWFVFASVCTYLIAYRFYSKVIERFITKPDDRRATPAEYKADGKDYVRTDRNVLFVVGGPEPDALTARVVERGAGETQACGTGACAAVYASARWGVVGSEVTVHMPGGDVHVALGDTITLTGPVEYVAEIEVPWP